MERLTNKREADAQRKDYENRIKNGYPRNIPEERFLRFAAYEDTKMPPELVEKVAKFAMWVMKMGLTGYGILQKQTKKIVLLSYHQKNPERNCRKHLTSL